LSISDDFETAEPDFLVEDTFKVLLVGTILAGKVLAEVETFCLLAVEFILSGKVEANKPVVFISLEPEDVEGRFVSQLKNMRNTMRKF
jgi:hypothetical protein